MNNVRFGIIGLGNIGSSHARCLLNHEVKRAELAAVCDAEVARLEAYRDRARVFDQLDDFLGADDIDVVLVATPHYAHVEGAVRSLCAGRHVLVEKPIAVHKVDAERMLAAHTDPKVLFGAMFNQRTNPAFRRIRQLISSGELGSIHRVQWTLTDWFRSNAYYAAGGWRATWAGEGGGVLVNQSPHQLDLLCWLFGSPRRVRAFCHFGKHHPIEVEDEVTAYLEYPNGMTAVFITSTGEAPGSNRLEIAGDRGLVVYENGQLRFTRNEVPTSTFCQTTKELFGVPATWDVRIPVSGIGGQHAEILQNFTDAVLDGVPLVAPAVEGVASVELANAMLLSTWLDQTIEFPLDGAVFSAELQARIAKAGSKSSLK